MDPQYADKFWLGKKGRAACLAAGACDLGGTLTNRSITRAAGAADGRETGPADRDTLIRVTGRAPRQRGTPYGGPSADQVARRFGAAPLRAVGPAPGGSVSSRAEAPEMAQRKRSA